MYCTVLFSTVIYCTVLHSAVLHFTVLYCTVLHSNVLYRTARYCTVLYYTELNCTVLYCTVLYFAYFSYIRNIYKLYVCRSGLIRECNRKNCFVVHILMIIYLCVEIINFLWRTSHVCNTLRCDPPLGYKLCLL